MKVNIASSRPPQAEKLKKAAVALEDLMLALRRSRFESLETALDALAFLVNQQGASGNASFVAKSYQSEDPNKHFLIGALPRLLLDKDLFPSNDDIVEFANAALNIDMRVEKRARFEIIGKIVCETDALDERQLTDLVRALERLVGDKDKIAAMVERKREGYFSWNETLQELLG